MSEHPPTPADAADDVPARARLARTVEEVTDALLSRWPESRLEPSLDRIAALCEVLGEPQRAYPAIHLTGTNGKTSTSRMVDALLRAFGLRTGRFTSPHVERLNERISLDGEPVTDEQLVRAFNDVAPFLALVDDSQDHPLSFFETVVGMAYAAFAEAPVDVAVVEVGMGGSWDATNVIDAGVAVVLPVARDHTQYLGDGEVAIATEKAGIIKTGAQVVIAEQDEAVMEVLLARCAEVDAVPVRAGADFELVSRVPAVGGQMLHLRGRRAEYEEVFLPLHGAHQAENAAVALAVVESFLGGEPLDAEVVREAFGQVESPGRLEVVRRSPTILLDAAHNPHGARALVAAIEDSFAFNPLVAVLGIMGDKDAEGLLEVLEPVLSHVVCTQVDDRRALPATELADLAEAVFGGDRVTVAPRIEDAIDQAAAMAESSGAFGEAIGAGGVLVTGSVVTVGRARALLVHEREVLAPPTARLEPPDEPEDDDDTETLDALGALERLVDVRREAPGRTERDDSEDLDA
ncbi:bifunctional folylpolyglutamate synthase/dihydrofolate synthase [Nocardioidaceae bacterium]|nr:bifunctional folylpolyglutamate synthase/dihydrofolate synthase [Nocardioidaceae bacterium]